MKVFLVNLNVGSAIEYCGDVIKKWLQEISNDLVEYKDQTAESITFQRLMKEQPDVIVVNETYPRIISPIFYYKMVYPTVQIILFVHSQKSLKLNEKAPAHQQNQQHILLDLTKLAEVVYTLDSKKMKILKNESPRFCPSEPELFYNRIPWRNRPNLFCIMGNIYPLKIHPDFLARAHDIPRDIDVYGNLLGRFCDPEYLKAFNLATNQNLKWKGPRLQSNVGDVLNKYKFIIFPHNGAESFFMMLQQAIMAGTIPLLYNESSGKFFDPHWVDWAEGLYLGADNLNLFMKNLVKLSTDTNDYTNLSKYISQEINKRFNYSAFKTDFQSLFSSNSLQ